MSEMNKATLNESIKKAIEDCDMEMLESLKERHGPVSEWNRFFVRRHCKKQSQRSGIFFQKQWIQNGLDGNQMCI